MPDVLTTTACPACKTEIDTPEPGAVGVCVACGEIYATDETGAAMVPDGELANEVASSTRFEKFRRRREELRATWTVSREGGPDALADHMLSTMTATLDRDFEEWERLKHPGGLLSAEAWLERSAGVPSIYHAMGQHITADRVEALTQAYDAQRARVQAYVDEIHRIDKQRHAAAAEIPDLLATMPRVRDFLERVPLSYFNEREELREIHYYGFSRQMGATFFVFMPDMTRDGIAQAVKHYAASEDPVALVFVSEFWLAKAETPEAKQYMSQPGASIADGARCERLGIKRGSALVATAETHAGVVGFSWPIETAADGTRRLGERGPFHVQGGRFWGLLPKRPARTN